MDILTRIQYESKVIPGAVATFRRASAATRAVFLRSQAKCRAQIRELARERKSLDDEYRAIVDALRAKAKTEVDELLKADEKLTREAAEARVIDFVTPFFKFREDHPEWADSSDEQKRIEEEGMRLSVLRALLVSIEGYTLSGVAPDAELLIAEAPIKLTEELANVADEIAGLDPTERGESPWPGISAKVGDGAKTSTTADSAGSEPAAV